jgi:radical SAM protein with 4Fe4S-binding SPASM domain
MSGSFDRTMQAIEWANEVGLPVQINTTFSRRNADDFEPIASLIESKKITLWSVFFLVPTGRGKVNQLLSAADFEQIFSKLHALAERARFHIKTTEAQHYRRYLLQQRVAERRNTEITAQDSPEKVHDEVGRAPRGLNDGKGFAFISHTGEVFPSGFLPLSGGNVRSQSLSDIYRTSPLFQQLRDPDQLGGKCGACEFRHICGGSRSRAFAMTGDPMAEEPCCSYIPKGYVVSELPATQINTATDLRLLEQ